MKTYADPKHCLKGCPLLWSRGRFFLLEPAPTLGPGPPIENLAKLPLIIAFKSTFLMNFSI